jgi:thiamine biosynthesis lipoprotein
VLSPETGKPVGQKKIVSVKAESALLAAFVANSWLILPDNDKEIIADQLHNVEIFEAEYLSNDLATKHTIIAENENNEE